MTEAMQNAQMREMKRVGKALKPEEQMAILESIDSSLIVAEIMNRLTKAEATLSAIKNDLD